MSSAQPRTVESPDSVGPAVRLDGGAMEVVLGPEFELLDGAHAGELLARVELCEQAKVSGLVVRFCASPAPPLLDVERLDSFSSRGQAEAALGEAERLVARLRDTALRTVAVVERELRGPNLELALACQRVLVAPALRVGLDGATLGVVPALGGVGALVLRLGALGALEHLLHGQLIAGEVAAELGLVDGCLPVDALVGTARQWIRRPRLERLGVLRHWLRGHARLPPRGYPVDARSDVAQALHGLVRSAFWSRDPRRASDAAFRCFSRLVCGEQSAALRGLARVLEERAPSAGAPPRLALIGGGRVGSELARRSLLAGGVVRLMERDETGLLRGVRRVHEQLRRAGLDGVSLERAMGHMTHTAELTRLGSFEVVIEAIAEEAVVKRRLLEQVATHLLRSSSEATLVTTSSTQELSRLASGSVGRVPLVGLHLGLVDERAYVELVSGEPTATMTIGRVLSALGYRVVPVADVAPGLCLRLVTAFIVEALELGREGYALSDVDLAARNWGFELGPSQLLDRLGQRTFSDLVAVGFLRSSRRFPAPARLEALLEAQPRRRRWSRLATPVPVERLVLRLVEEARAALQEGVVARAELADLAAVWGMGFPAYRGGPLSYAARLGEQKVQRRLSRLATLHGPRFEPNVVL
ncbi:MAG: 3-hydroxyacyl-CoA dehydrogenase NAD-binding domain-containing protein [Polyangiaceae bacterium]